MLETISPAERYEVDPITLAAVTTEIVAAYITRNAVPPADLMALISTVHGTLSALSDPPEPFVDAAERPTPALPIRKSVTDSHIFSLETGKPYKALRHHLANLGMTPTDYRAKWGLPVDYPMVAPAYSRARSALAKKMGLGNLRRKR